MHGLHERGEPARHHQQRGGGKAGHDLRDGDDVTEHEEEYIVIPREPLQRLPFGGGEGGDEADGDGHEKARGKEQQARGALPLPLYLVGHGGVGARHQPREQPHDREHGDIQQPLHGEKAEQEPDDRPGGDGQQEAHARPETAQEVAQRVQQFIVQAEDDGDRRTAHARHDNGEPDEKAEQPAAQHFLLVFVFQRGQPLCGLYLRSLFLPVFGRYVLFVLRFRHIRFPVFIVTGGF